MPRLLGLESRLPGSKFEPTILCDIRSWNYTTFPSGHFNMVWASPVCTEYSRALTTRPQRLLKTDALVLSALEILARFGPLVWVVENPATGLPKTRPFCKYGTPYRKQSRLWTNMRWRRRSAQARQPLRRVAGWQAPPRCAARARLMEGAAEHSGLGRNRRALHKSIFPCFCLFFGGALNAKKGRVAAGLFWSFLLVSFAVPLNVKNDEEWHRRFFCQ